MMNARKKSIGILTAMFGLTMCFAIPTAISASAAETTETPATTITMEKGASLKLDKVSGLKFTATVENAKEGANYGMLILPYDYFADAEVNITDSTDYVKAFLSAWDNDVIAREPILAQNLPVVDGKISYSIHNVLENNYDREFFGIAFEKTSTEAGDTYTYATYNDNVRSIMEVASGALNAYNYEKASLSEDLIATYEANMDLLNSFVDTGVTNAIGKDATLNYAIEGGDVAKLHSNVILDLNLTETKHVHLQNVWSSSDETVATVDNNGVITTIGEGETTISVKSAGKYSAEKVITVEKMTQAEVVDAVYALDKGATLAGGNYTLTGVITKVNTVYNPQYSNVTVTIVVEGREKYPIECYRLKGTGADVIGVGDTITVTGTLKNFDGTEEFDKDCTLDSYTISAERMLKETYEEICEVVPLVVESDDIAVEVYTAGKKYQNVTIDWSEFVESDSAKMVGGKLTFIRLEEEQTVEFYLTFSCDGVSRRDKFVVTVASVNAVPSLKATLDFTDAASHGLQKGVLPKQEIGENKEISIEVGEKQSQYNSGQLRFYAGDTLTFTPSAGVKVLSISIESDSSYTLVGNCTATNGEIASAGNEVLITVTDGKSPVVITNTKSSQTRLQKIIVNYVYAGELTSEDKVNKTFAEVEAFEMPTSLRVGEKIENLPIAGVTYSEVTIAWKKGETAIEGSTVEFVESEAETEVTLTATISLDTIEKTCSFKITVEKAVTVGEPITETITLGNYGLANAVSFSGEGQMFGDVKITGDKGTNANNDPKYYTSDSTLRMYAGNTLTISVEGYKILSITDISGSTLTALTTDSTEYSLSGSTITVTNTEGVDSIVITSTDKPRITAFTITYVKI